MPSETPPPPQTTISCNNSPGGAITTTPDKTNRSTTPLSVKSFRSLSPPSQNSLSLTTAKGHSPSSLNIAINDDGSLNNVATPIKLISSSLSSSDKITTEQNLSTISASNNNNDGDGGGESSSTNNDIKINNNTSSNTTNNNINSSSNNNNTNGNSNNTSQQFCLRWNNYQSNLTSVFDQLLQNESFVDVTLACDGQSIKAHKMVLSACSPYFQTLFVDNPCQHPIIIMRDVKWFELKSIVDFMYKGEINVSQDQIGPLLRVAEMLKIRGLADVNNDTENSNSNNISNNNNNNNNNISTSSTSNSNSTTATSTVTTKTSSSSATTIPITTTTTSSSTSISSSKPIISARKNDELNNLSALDLPDIAVKKARVSREWELSNIEVSSVLSQQQQQQQQHHHSQQQQQIHQNRHRKRRWPSSDNSHRNTESPLSGIGNVGDGGSSGNGGGGRGGSNNSNCGSISGGGIPSGGSSTPETNLHDIGSPVANAVAQSVASNMNIMSTTPHPPVTPSPMPPFPLGGSLEALGLPSLSGMSHADDLEIKPGIAEMIREEERAKLMENSHAWLGASTSSIADSYQYQLQSMWQKCWNTNQNLMHHLRFRERGPLKSWRPETMAEAIFSVLKEGLSLSQAARKYDIPYPTFVLYANRVHNMLGPSIDGGTDLRPKGRGRPQRILLGIWPDEHIKGVIKTVVFRDAKELKEESQMHLQYGRHSPVFPFQENPLNYPGGPCPNGIPSQGGSSESMSPEATAAAVAAVAHGIRQQMQMAAAAQHHPDSASNLYNLPAHLQAHVGGVSIPKQSSPASAGSGGGGGDKGSGGGGSSGSQMNSNSQRHSSPQMIPNPASLASLAGIPGLHIIPGLSSSQSNQSSGGGGGGNSGNSGHHMSTYSSNSSSSHHHSHHHSQHQSGSGNSSGGSHHHHHHHSSLHSNLSRNQSPSESAHDLRMNSPDDSPLHSPLEMSLEPAVNLAIGVSGMTYKASRGYSSPRGEHLFQEDIADLVGAATSAAARNCPPNLSINNFKEPSPSIKIEPIAECRGD